MGYEVVRTHSFEHDMFDAIDYLATILKNRQAAQLLVDQVDNAVSILESTPFVRAVSPKPMLKQYDMREYFIGNYTIIYTVNEHTTVVKLHRLFHQLQQYDSKWYWAND